MKKNKKGFTLVELVIVIAVIAILAAVLIPTFTTVINNANQSAALQEGTNLKTEILQLYQGDFDKYCEDYATANETASTTGVAADTTIFYTTWEGASDKTSTFGDFVKVDGTTTIKIDGTEHTITYKSATGFNVTIKASGVEATKSTT